MNRRSFLAAASTSVLMGIAGCSSWVERNTPAGSLRFVNDHRVPHSFTMRVTDVGTEPGTDAGAVTGEPIVAESQATLTAGTSVPPGEQVVYEDVFTESVWYAVEFLIDGQVPASKTGVTAFRPSPTDQADGKILGGTVSPSGEFSWTVSSTDNPGRFR